MNSHNNTVSVIDQLCGAFIIMLAEYHITHIEAWQVMDAYLLNRTDKISLIKALRELATPPEPEFAFLPISRTSDSINQTLSQYIAPYINQYRSTRTPSSVLSLSAAKAWADAFILYYTQK